MKKKFFFKFFLFTVLATLVTFTACKDYDDDIDRLDDKISGLDKLGSSTASSVTGLKTELLALINSTQSAADKAQKAADGAQAAADAAHKAAVDNAADAKGAAKAAQATADQAVVAAAKAQAAADKAQGLANDAQAVANAAKVAAEAAQGDASLALSTLTDHAAKIKANADKAAENAAELLRVAEIAQDNAETIETLATKEEAAAALAAANAAQASADAAQTAADIAAAAAKLAQATANGNKGAIEDVAAELTAEVSRLEGLAATAQVAAEAAQAAADANKGEIANLKTGVKEAKDAAAAAAKAALEAQNAADAAQADATGNAGKIEDLKEKAIKAQEVADEALKVAQEAVAELAIMKTTLAEQAETIANNAVIAANAVAEVKLLAEAAHDAVDALRAEVKVDIAAALAKANQFTTEAVAAAAEISATQLAALSSRLDDQVEILNGRIDGALAAAHAAQAAADLAQAQADKNAADLIEKALELGELIAANETAIGEAISKAANELAAEAERLGGLIAANFGAIGENADAITDLQTKAGELGVLITNNKIAIGENADAIAGLVSKLASEATRLEGLITAAHDAANAAQGTANDAVAAAALAQAKADKVEADLATLRSEFDTLSGDITTLKNKINDRIEDVDALFDAVNADILALQERAQAIEDEIDALKGRVDKLFGERVTSVTLLPTSHVDGIASILFKSMEFTPQALLETQIAFGFTIKDDDDATSITVGNDANTAKFRVSPRNASVESITIPFFESIISENIKLASADNTGRDTPIKPVKDQVLTITDEGILEIQVEKTIDESLNISNGKFYFTSVSLPIAYEYLTKEEKLKKDNVVTSEHYRLHELLTTARIRNSKAGKLSSFVKDDGTSAGIVYNLAYAYSSTVNTLNLSDDADTTSFDAVYYSDLALLKAKNSVARFVDHKIEYEAEQDLLDLVTVVARDNDENIIEDYAAYGLEYRFELIKEFKIGTENQQDFASILDGVLTSKSVGGVSPIGKQPVIKVSLVNTKKSDALVDMRYIMVKWAPRQVGPVTIPFERVAECGTQKFLINEDMMDEYFYTPADLTKEEFWANYIMKSTGGAGTHGSLKKELNGTITWTVGETSIVSNVGKTIKHPLTFNYGGNVIDVTLTLDIIQPTVKVTGLLDNYWYDNYSHAKFNSSVPISGDTNPNNFTFVTDINSIFDTEGGKVLSLKDYKYDFIFADNQPFVYEGVKEMTVSSNGKTLIAILDDGLDTQAHIAQIDSDGKLTYGNGVTAKRLLNIKEESMKARLGVVVKLDCDIEVKVTGLGKNDGGTFDVHFLRPINVDPETAKPFIDAAGLGNPGSILDYKTLVTLSDWRNRVKDGNYYFETYPNFYNFYDVTSITVDKSKITTHGLTIDGQPTDKLPTTIVINTTTDGVYGSLTYENNGANLSTDFTLLVPVTVKYKWGDVSTVVNVTVQRTAN